MPNIPKIELFKRYFSPIVIVYIIALTIFLSYYTIKWTPNEHLINITKDNTSVQKAVLYYTRLDQVPVKQFGENNFNHWGVAQVLLTVVSFIVFIIILNREKEWNLKSIDSGKQKVYDYCMSNKNFKKVHILEPSHLQHYRVDDGKPAPYKREIFAEIEVEDTDIEGGWRYFSFVLNPFTNELLDIIELETRPTSQMKCPNCGASPDFKTYTPKGLKEYREKWKEKT